MRGRASSSVTDLAPNEGARVLRGLFVRESASDVAARAGVPCDTLRRYALGSRLPTPAARGRLELALGIDPEAWDLPPCEPTHASEVPERIAAPVVEPADAGPAKAPAPMSEGIPEPAIGRRWLGRLERGDPAPADASDPFDPYAGASAWRLP